ncbi:pyruvate phosphate dikinase PEP/pyruvate-binding protein [Leptolyngbya valderiana BDU 20041]|nr:pyruvate phosphate dikinase PEP/pyruvate-binding protein [Leptolyngbya valderiana BDU 20041]
MISVWASVPILLLASFLIGGLPLIRWIVLALGRKDLRELGTGNVSVSAAFYHGGRWLGILAVLSEAGKGIAAVLLARSLVPDAPIWELVALLVLVLGRYTLGQGAGTTNVVWGVFAHDWRVAVLVALISGLSFTVVRERRAGRNLVLVLLPAVMWMLYPHAAARVVAAGALSAALYWTYRSMTDDLDLSPSGGRPETRKLFRFFRADRALVTLDRLLDARNVGAKAATLSQLRRWGYPVPMGWVLKPGDDPEILLESLHPSQENPLVVRSSALGEDTERASAAGQYESVANVTDRQRLFEAIERCLASASVPSAVRYRQERGIEDSDMAVLVQQQIRGVFSGVAFSRDPILRCGDAVAIEALPGAASQVVSGQVTPERYRVFVPDEYASLDWNDEETGKCPELVVDGEPGDVPQGMLRRVAVLVRQLERRFQQVPQDVEWSFDGQHLWLLQSRPIPTLLPIWTRKIAAEVIPGCIRPLTWSINRPLTCGVWGDIFSIVLGSRAEGLAFHETATLHDSHAYFNASLLGEIFHRMGLPPESLEFLTLGTSTSKPPLFSTLRNLPGLLRLLGRQRRLGKDFDRDDRETFAPLLAQLDTSPVLPWGDCEIASAPSPSQLLDRIERILEGLERATYYNILAPLGFAAQKAVLKVDDDALDTTRVPEVAALRALQELAASARLLLPEFRADRPTPTRVDTSSLFARLAETTDGNSILEAFDRFLDRFGYLSEVGTDISVPTWREDPHPVRELFAKSIADPTSPPSKPTSFQRGQQWVQQSLELKGRVAEVYSCLLAQLRWSFVALERLWLDAGLLAEPGDIFFLVFREVRTLVTGENPDLAELVPALVAQRRAKFERDRQLPRVPRVTYGTPAMTLLATEDRPARSRLRGIGASAGQVEGYVKVVRNLAAASKIDRQTILVVPYTDAGWMPLLAQAGGLIAEVGGRLSHGAIVAREYGIPAVMDVAEATRELRDGQHVRLDGEVGLVEIL